MPNKKSKKPKQHGKSGAITALFVTLFLAGPGALLPAVEKGEKIESPAHSWINVTVNNVQNNVTVINQSTVK